MKINVYNNDPTRCFLKIKNFSYIDFQKSHACAQMYCLYTVFFQVWTRMNKFCYLNRDAEASWKGQAEAMELECPEKEIFLKE